MHVWRNGCMGKGERPLARAATRRTQLAGSCRTIYVGACTVMTNLVNQIKNVRYTEVC